MRHEAITNRSVQNVLKAAVRTSSDDENTIVHTLSLLARWIRQGVSKSTL
jgi:hypothetical protein